MCTVGVPFWREWVGVVCIVCTCGPLGERVSGDSVLGSVTFVQRCVYCA